MKVKLVNSGQRHFNISSKDYLEMYNQSIENPKQFFAYHCKQFLDWFEPWEHTCQGRVQNLPVEWFVGGQINLSYNCIDRHLPQHANKIAILWEGNEESEQLAISYQELHDNVCRMANIFKSYGMQKGDVICIYMPLVPEAIYAMLACARIGAIHNVIFGGFSSQSIASRINDSGAKMVITTNASFRGNKLIPFKNIIDDALKDCATIKKVLVVNRHENHAVKMQSNRDIWYHEAVKTVDHHCPPVAMFGQDPLFILYTSGSTGKPKGIVHATAGYALHVAMSYYYLFNHQSHTKHWCTADIGWITGHSYTVYGPLLNASTTFICESIPSYPNHHRFAQIIERHQITNFYTAPTLLRSLKHEGDQHILPYNLNSLELLGSVGEPINPEVWLWFFNTFGKKRCPIINTWWQTESGGILLSPLPCDEEFTPGSGGKPFFGVKPFINQQSMLYIQQPWPGMLQTIYKDPKRLSDAYFSQPELGYLTGDGAYFEDQEYHITGRLDDIIKVSGHRLGTEELESALVAHVSISEAAVVGIPHPIKGEGIIAFVIIHKSIEFSEKLNQLLIEHLRQTLGPVATPEKIIWVNGLPKTRSGKIMRRLLKKIAQHDIQDLGDTSSLADPLVIDEIIRSFQQQSSELNV